MRPLLLALVAVSVVVPPDLAFAQAPPAGRRLAFLVGVKEYDHSQLKKLDYPERDVDDFAAVLTKSGFDRVVVLTTGRGAKDASLKPTVENINAWLDRLLTPKSRADGLRVTKHDTILVALAGHGIQPLGSDLAYFCPQDANPTIIAAVDKTPGKAKFPDTLVAIDALLTTLDDSGVGHKLLLMDACRNDPGVRGRRGVDRVKVSALPPDTAVLLSCSPGQFAFEDKAFGGGHGAFFHHVIEGFQGAAVDEEEGGVTFDSLVKHVGKTVPKSVDNVFGKDGGQQKPNRIVNLTTDTLLLARVTPIKPPAMIPKSDPTQKPTPDSYAKSIISPATGMKLVLILAGEYTRGSPNSDNDALHDEKPPHKVKITKDFYLGQHEVTQGQWNAVMGTEPWKGKNYVKEGTNYPATYVSYGDAVAFCRKLSEKDGRTYRLPTEAEWEYAARGGKTTRYSFGDDESKLGEYAWYDKNADDIGERFAHQVGLKQPNGYGLFDMHGNVWEWCADWYNANEYRVIASKAVVDPSGPESEGRSVVLRGGSWVNHSRFARSACRFDSASSDRFRSGGFRLARTP